MLTIAKKFSLFTTINELNHAVNSFKDTIKGFVPKSVFKVVDFLATHSAKIKGVSFATYDYMHDMTGLSISTLKRAIKRLLDLGFIQVINVWVGGRQRANIYQIQSNINLEELAERLFGKVSFEFFSPNDDTQNEPHNDTQNDTLCDSEETASDKPLPGFFRKGSNQSSKASKTEINIKIDTSAFEKLMKEGSNENDPFINSIFRKS